MTLDEVKLKIMVETLSMNNNVLLESLAKATVELEDLRAKQKEQAPDNVEKFTPEAK